MAATKKRQSAADRNEDKVKSPRSRARTSDGGGEGAKGKTTGSKGRPSGTGGKAAGTKSRAASGRGQKNWEPPVEETEDFIGAEVLIILSFAAAVLFFLSNFHLCGAAGSYLRAFQLGIFGIVGFIAPFLLFVGTCFYLSNRGNLTAMRKMLASVGVVLVLCGFAQLLFGKVPEEGKGVLEYYRLSSENGTGGGLIGGLICLVLTSLVGNIGAFLILLVSFAISAVCITERSLVRAIKKQGDAAYRYAREDMSRRKEVRAEQKEERRLQKEQKIRGVNLDSTDLSAMEEAVEEGPYEGAETAGTWTEPADDWPEAEANTAGYGTERENGYRETLGYAEDGRTGKAGEEKTQRADNSQAERAGSQRAEVTGKENERTVTETTKETIKGTTKTGADRLAEGAEKGQETYVDPADVFTGRITMASGYGDEDGAPFDADKVLSPAESAQRLVAEGISRLSDPDGSFGRPAEPPAFPPPASEPSFSGLASAMDKPKEKEEKPEKSVVKTNTESLMDSWDRLAMADLAEEEEGLPGDISENQGEERKEKPETFAREVFPKERGYRPPVVRYEEDEEEQEIFMDGWEVSEQPEGYMPDGTKTRDYVPDSTEPGGYTPDSTKPGDYISNRTGTKGHMPDHTEPDGRPEPVSKKDGAGPGERVLDRGIYEDAFVIPRESKQVVTASGKVIDSDTEALQKKLEAKRQEAQEALASGEAGVKQQIQAKKEQPRREYVFPSVTLLKRGNLQALSGSGQEYKDTAVKLQQTLRDFGVGVTVTNISCGPAVTRYELHPEQGVKVSKIVGLSDDIKLSLAAADIRIEAPIPGKSAVGIEVPNKENITVYLRELLESEAFKNHPSRLAFAVGKDIGGQVVVTDIAKMPHLLIAGATGSGKSVCINTLIMSILFKSSPDDVKLIMVDPKVVELSVYNGIPHLLIPVVTDPKKASGALNWAVAEMQDRYNKFAACNVRNINGYNARIESLGDDVPQEEKPEKMPQIVIIVDELADLMMVAPGEVEDAICRLAQLARAAGIHLVIATQRPSVNVITGLIKANVPSRIAFSVSSGVDSRTIIDMYGAEKLLGKGDMLFFPAGIPKPQRVQGAFVSDSEVQRVVEFLAEQGMSAQYNPDVEKQMNAIPQAAGPGGGSGGNNNGRDEYFEQAGRFIIEKDKASIGMLQRMFKIGFNRAARIMDQLADAGVVGDEEGTKPRKILITMEEFEELLECGE